MKKLVLFIFLLSLTTRPVMAANKIKSLIPSMARNSKRVASEAGELKGKVEQKREVVKARKEKMLQIKDGKKQQIAEHINDRLAHINEKATTTLSKVLVRLTAILNKLADKTDIEAATVLIATAQEAVEAQALKVYEIEFEDESGLRAGASTAKESLKADLKALRDLTREAHGEVKNAIKAAKGDL